MVHGAGGGGWEWRFWEPIFQKRGWKTIAPDLMPSVSGLESTKLTDYEAQALGWGRRLGNRPLVYVGASLGGLLALAVSRKLRPDALVLVNSVPPKGVSKKTPPIDYPAVVKWANGPLQETRTAMPDCDEATIQFAWKRWRDESGAVMNELGRGVELPNPTCPVLVVIGENDTDVSPDTSLALASQLRADVFRYAGTSHVGPLLGKRAPEIAEAVEGWLARNLARESVESLRRAGVRPR